MNKSLTYYLCTLLLGMCLANCGGNNEEVAGIDGSGAPIASSTGTIDGFGSVIVNGVRYDSSKARIRINNALGSEEDLHTGYRVKITGTKTDNDAGVADTIEFRPDLVGIITHIDLAKEQLRVLNQLIQITNATIFDAAITPNNLEGLTIGNQVLISGQINNEGIITATRVEPTQQHHQLNGVIRDLDQRFSTFIIRDVTVNYSAATLHDINNSQLTNGMRVSVSGTLDDTSTLQALDVSEVNDRFGSEIQKAEIEGFITRFVSHTDFDVDGIHCTTTNQTEYEQGTQGQLMLGATVEIKGRVNTQGVLVAREIEFERGYNNRIEGQVTSITLDTSGAIVTGTLQIGDTSIQTTNSTRYEDKSNSQVRRFNISSIQTGDFLQVSGFDNNGIFVATKIERKRFNSDEDTELTLEGTITNVGTNSFVIVGQEVIVTEQTEIHGASAESLTADEFLAIAQHLRVEVEVILRDGVFIASEIDIDEDATEEDDNEDEHD